MSVASTPLVQAKRIGHATFDAPDLERQIAYYTQVLGFNLVAREAHRAFLATNAGVLSVVLEKNSAPACTKLSFEVSPQLSFAEIARRLSAAGIKSEVRSDAIPGVPEMLTFSDQKGTRVELFSSWQFLDRAPAVGGNVPLKLGHVAFVVQDPQATAEFYGQTLGFRVSDWIGDYFVFLRCGVDHHTVNFIRGDAPRLHHIAFELRDAGHLHNSCDLLGQKNIDIIWGPVRHGPGHNVATYHRNPDDHIIELFVEMDQMLDEELGYFDPRPWHRDRPQKPKVWDGQGQRDIWGQGPSADFRRTDGKRA